MIPVCFEREALLIGEDKVKKLMSSSVAVFGAGGVGSYVIEGLVRAGVGKITVIDNDTVSETNINRQLIADTTTVGKYKAEVAVEKAKRINPGIEAKAVNAFVTKENARELLEAIEADYIVDAIDTVSAKLAIIEYAAEKNVKIISSMGTGNKLDPTRLKVSDISKTSVCPLARVMRQELKHRGISKLNVLWSDEPPVKNADGETPVIKADGRNAPGSISFVPSVGGLIISAHVVKDIIML